MMLFAVAGCSASSGGPASMMNNNAGQTLASLEVQPATATIDVENGAGTPVSFTVLGHYADGHVATVDDASLTLDASAQLLGALSGAQFTASGTLAGSGQVQASSGGLSANATVTVTVHTVRLGMNVPPGASSMFGNSPAPMGSASPTIDYPLDGAVMPSSVKSPDVQWEGPSAPGDLVRVRLAAGGATVDGISVIDAASTLDWQPGDDDWALLVNSANGAPLTVTVDHYDATNGAQGGKPVQVKIVKADVRGVLYYWDLSEGKMQRLDDTGRSLAIPNPPPSPSDANNHCVACHVVSQNGRYLAGELWGGGQSGAVFDLSNPATTSTTGTAPTLAPTNTYNALFSTFNPDASRLLVNDGTSLQLIDPMNGMSLMTQGTPLPSSKAAHPAWSPDGSMIAFISDIDGAWGVDYTVGNVSIIPVTGPDTFGPPQPLVMTSTGDPSFKAPSWPTFTPDSQWIAYAAGVNSRGRNTVTNPSTNTTSEMVYPGGLFVVGRNGGTPTRLDNACSGQLDCYLPNFSPYDQGGYFWLVFYSVRDYGNSLAGTRGTQRRQMWVTAIDKSKLGSGDASSTPYWLPQQDPKTENMSAFWTVPPPLQ